MPKDPKPPKPPKDGVDPITEYQIVTAKTPKALQTKIENLILDGWRPQGGVTYQSHFRMDESYRLIHDMRFIQAIVR